MELWERRRTLGQRVAGQRRLYLDLRFWNDLCDVALGKSRQPQNVEFLTVLRSAVANEDVVCPIEFHVFSELYKQRLSEKQAATIALVDELSARTVLISPPERVFLEVVRLSQALMAGLHPDAPPLEEMWTRPMYVAGHATPDLPAVDLPPAIVERLREEIDEEIWEFGFAHLTEHFVSLPLGVDEKAETAHLLNRAKRDPSTQFPSFNATYWSEVLGTMDGYLDQLGDVSLYLYHRGGGDPASVSQDDVRAAALKLKALLYKAARKTGLRGPVPSIRTRAMTFSISDTRKPLFPIAMRSQRTVVSERFSNAQVSPRTTHAAY